MPRNQSEKTPILAHKAVFPANWRAPAHVFLFKRDDLFWVMSHDGSHSSDMDRFIGKASFVLAESRHLYEALTDGFWFDALPGELRSWYVERLRQAPPGWLDSKERKQCIAERERL